MKNEKTSGLLIFLYCLYAYSFTLSRGAVFGYVITYGIPFIYLILHQNIFKDFFLTVTKEKLIFYFVYGILAVLSIALPTFYGTADYSYIKVITYVIRKIIQYTFLAAVTVRYHGKKTAPEHFMYYFALATAIYVCVTIIMVGVPGLKEFWLSIVASEESTELLKSFGYNFRIGWMGVSGFRATLKCSISIAFIMYLGTDKHSLIKLRPVVYAFIFGMSILGNTFYGRSGLLVSGLVIILTLLLNKKITGKSFFKILIGIFLLFWVIYALKDVNTAIHSWYVWFSTPFINLITTGSFNNASFDSLAQDMYFSVDMKTLLLGDARFVNQNGGYYMSTDAGFMRNILFWGLPVTLINYMCTILPLKDMGRRFFGFGVVIIVTFLLMEYKGDVYYEFSPLLFALACLEIYNGRKNRNGTNNSPIANISRK